MEMVAPVNDSSTIARIGFDGSAIHVQFNSGKTYQYPDCCEATFESLRTAPSPGKWLNENLKSRGTASPGPAGHPAATPIPALRDRQKATQIHVTQSEGCCTKMLNNASVSGKLDGLTEWECPQCGLPHIPKVYGPLINWEAQAAVMLIGRR